jgi:endonuclease YncB( thermonuclease family)
MSGRLRLCSFLVAAVVACGHPAVDRGASGSPSTAEPVRIVRIIDAERWVLSIDGRDRRIRLIGVDARFARRVGGPPTDDPSDVLVAGAPLLIEQDSRAEDAAGRAWVWLWSGDELVNAAVLRNGVATLGRYWPNQRHETEMLQAQLSAARGRRGFWRACVSLRRAISTEDPRRSCDPSYPGRCVPPFPPALDCDQISFANFRIEGPDVHDLDGDGDGLGCERFNPM